ncbi:carbonic anhydrase 4 isoform X2 [Nomia melanderi]|uniref:carbonic anhydrase 4 isoform X2 n=1 Tax=Nomia melanderi TaxID=2448451 RepID=UPI00130459C3|nr:carbonic anhydrase 4-like isoform X2 [Nomia melanderi]
MKSSYIIFNIIVGPAQWQGLCATGKKQSPINIVPEKTEKADLGALKFVRYDYAFSGNITNNGHSVQIQLIGLPIQLEGGSLPYTYILEQIHFHWPAEHTVDGDRDALEVHFVHYNEQYENVTVASQHEDGIAVVATLFELDYEDNEGITPIVEATELVSKWVGKSTAKMRSKVIPDLLLPKDHTTYYRYSGSLTTPGCQESVTWLILTEKLTISEQQLKVFKNIGTDNGTLSFNYRPVQALGGRKVHHRLDGYSLATVPRSNLFFTLFSFLFIKLLLS